MPSRLLIVLLATCLVPGCVNPAHPSAPERFTGHWTLGAIFSEFATSDGRAFYVLADDMPEVAYKFLIKQRSHRDATSDSGSSVSAYFEVIGTLLPYNDGPPGATATHQRLHVERVLRMEKAHADYLASFKH